VSLHTKLPIHATGSKLLSLAIRIKIQMPRDVKRLGDEIKAYCIEMLTLMARANASMKPADRRGYIERLLEVQNTVQILLRICLDDKYMSVKLWAQATELLDGIGKQGGGWLKKTNERTAGAPAA